MERNLNQWTYEQMRNDILTFVLKPGDHVSAAKIAERYEVSRTPAREAIVRLAAEGMVDIYPQSKTVISKIDTDRVLQEWFVRRSLELSTADSFIERVQDNDLELMRAYQRELERLSGLPASHEAILKYLNCDNDFHAVTYMVAGQELSAKIISAMMAHYNRLRMLIDFDILTKRRTLVDHEEILRCAGRRDKNGYRDILDRHISHIIEDIALLKEKYPDYFEM